LPDAWERRRGQLWGMGHVNCEDAVLLVYLVEEGKDIYIGVLVLVCHLATYLATWDPDN
jgi:hypothetical protein